MYHTWVQYIGDCAFIPVFISILFIEEFLFFSSHTEYLISADVLRK